MDDKVLLRWATQRHLSIPTLLLQMYKQIGLSETELVAILHIQSFIEVGETFPTPELLSQRMNINQADCAELIGFLVKNKYVSIEKTVDTSGIVIERLSLDLLWGKLFHCIQGEVLTKREEVREIDEGALFRRFEEEFARPLSPIEAETLSLWLDEDKHSPDLIMAALREAVVSSKLNFRYIDRILFEWKKNGIKSIAQAKAYGEKFRKYNNKAQRTEQPKVQHEQYPGFGWLKQ